MSSSDNGQIALVLYSWMGWSVNSTYFSQTHVFT